MTVRTRLGAITTDDVFVRGKSLCQELIGKVTFTDMIFLEITGGLPSDAQRAVLDACLVTLVEHGLTPSAIAARLVYGSSPEAMQGAVAAGLLGVGSVFVGTVEGCAALLAKIVASPNAEEAAQAIADEHRADRRPLPGFGHPQHKPDDPRTPRILGVAEERGIAGPHIRALRSLSTAAERAFGRHLTINATGAIAAALGDCGIPTEIMRGFALISRCAGLVGHVHEEQAEPASRAMWEAADRAVPYDAKP
jgi:citrate synthase